jgi:hypothetical protein
VLSCCVSFAPLLLLLLLLLLQNLLLAVSLLAALVLGQQIAHVVPVYGADL